LVGIGEIERVAKYPVLFVELAVEELASHGLEAAHRAYRHAEFLKSNFARYIALGESEHFGTRRNAFCQGCTQSRIDHAATLFQADGLMY
jgi:hypothetical protein